MSDDFYSNIDKNGVFTITTEAYCFHCSGKANYIGNYSMETDRWEFKCENCASYQWVGADNIGRWKP